MSTGPAVGIIGYDENELQTSLNEYRGDTGIGNTIISENNSSILQSVEGREQEQNEVKEESQ